MNARTAIVLGSVTALAALGLPPLQAGGAPAVRDSHQLPSNVPVATALHGSRINRLSRLPMDTAGGMRTAEASGIATFSTLPAFHRGPKRGH